MCRDQHRDPQCNKNKKGAQGADRPLIVNFENKFSELQRKNILRKIR